MEHERKNSTVTVRISGELDHCSAQSIRRELDALIGEPGVKTLILDLRDMTFMDSSGIGLIMGRFKRMTELGSDILIANPSPAIRKLIGLASVERVVRVVYTAHSASVSN